VRTHKQASNQTIYVCKTLLYEKENKSGKGPSWLFLRDNLLYAVNKHDDQIETFTIDDRNQGKLTLKNTISSIGNTPCSLDIDPTGKWLAVAK